MNKIILVPKVEYDVTKNKDIVLSEENQKHVADWDEKTIAWASSFGKGMYGLELNEFLDFMKTWKVAKGFSRKPSTKTNQEIK